MHATRILMEEHRVIERVLDALETAAQRLGDGVSVPAGAFLRGVEFITGFADGVHHRKEEGVLFPAMESAGMAGEGSPIHAMLAEHHEARALTRAMHAAAERLEANHLGAEAARDELVRSVGQYAALLRQHIAKEDQVLFPMAEQLLQGRVESEVAAEFERIAEEEAGEGVRERFVALAASIERQLAG